LEIYRVGGSVRDELLGEPIEDTDFVVVGSSEKEMLKNGFKKVTASFPVFLKDGSEYALARREKKIGIGYSGFSCETESVTLEEDLSRRDFTINAIAISKSGDLIDPYGGVEDLKNGILRHISSAFKEDPLRVVRLARFQSRFPSFKIARETKEIVLEILNSGELKTLSKERLYLEIEKSHKKGSLYLFFKTLKELKVLSEIFPNLKSCENLQLLSKTDLKFHLTILSLPELPIPKKYLKFKKRFQNTEMLFKNLSPENLVSIFDILKDDVDEVLKLWELLYWKLDRDKIQKAFQIWKRVPKEMNFSNLKNIKETLFKERVLRIEKLSSRDI
jgi:tRNA nucleotidyltransferase/poly(A) polymerase